MSVTWICILTLHCDEDAGDGVSAGMCYSKISVSGNTIDEALRMAHIAGWRLDANRIRCRCKRCCARLGGAP